MKNRRLSWVSVVVVVMLLATSLFMFGCEEEEPETPTKTLKIGVVTTLSNATGLEYAQTCELMAEMENQNGGLEVGGERYNVEMIICDFNNEQTKDVAAINKLVYEDNVDYIFSSSPYVMSWIDTTEAEKVIVFNLGIVSEAFGPEYEYYWGPTGERGASAAVFGWMQENYPETLENMVVVFPEGPYEDIIIGACESLFGLFGVEPTYITYPASATDLSAMATKVLSLNPTVVLSTGAGDLGDVLGLKAIYQAGYRGLMFTPDACPTGVLLQALSAEAAEGAITGAWATYFDPGLTEEAQEFMDAWAAKYGEWPDINSISTTYFSCLRAALQEAGTTDVDAVKAVLDNGLTFSSPSSAEIMMISRPDVGNERTVDSIATVYAKIVENGESELLFTLDPEEVLVYFRMQYPPQ